MARELTHASEHYRSTGRPAAFDIGSGAGEMHAPMSMWSDRQLRAQPRRHGHRAALVRADTGGCAGMARMFEACTGSAACNSAVVGSFEA